MDKTQTDKKEESVVEELTELGRQLAAALRTAWQSEERRQLEQELSEGLNALAQELDEAIKAAKESPATEELRRHAEKVVQTAQETPLGQELREGLLTGLRTLNAELSRLTEKLQEQQRGASPARPAQEVPIETEEAADTGTAGEE
ncbi:MAG TPA: hypothetical protein EYP04_13565 [Anaerolineae bacterium]|nr:hypothetical protein [Anaerolineae bacterium]HIQ05620.1 hypothetical protein [Anaerolineae bacterium]